MTADKTRGESREVNKARQDVLCSERKQKAAMPDKEATKETTGDER